MRHVVAVFDTARGHTDDHEVEHVSNEW